MAFGKKTKTADEAPAAKPTRARRSKPTPPPAPEIEPAPELSLDDLPAGWVARATWTEPEVEAAVRDQYRGGRTWPPSHDEEW